MDEIYKMTSTERIQMLEKELAVQVTEPKSEKNRVLFWEQLIELTGGSVKTTCYSSKCLQRELESCLRREYTPENLPLLLLQNQVAYIMQENSDALQRTDRLSAAPENFLMGKNNPPNLVMQEDLTIYTKLLVCHLYALRTIHHYLQCLPVSNVLNVAVDEVPEVGQENENVHVNDISPDIQGSASPGPMDTSIPGCEKQAEGPVYLTQEARTKSLPNGPGPGGARYKSWQRRASKN